MTREEEIKKIALCYAHDELKDNHGDVEDIVASAFIDGVNYADAHPHWISVEDELPKKDGRYLFYDETSGVYTSAYYVEFSLLGSITHWMPLPSIEHLKKGGKE